MIRRWRKRTTVEAPRQTRKGKSENVRKLRWTRSLMSRYILLILCAVLFVPVVLPIISVTYVVIANYTNHHVDQTPYGDATGFGKMWIGEGRRLDGVPPKEVDARLRKLHDDYPESSIYRVNGKGETELILPGTGVEVAATKNAAKAETRLKWMLGEQRTEVTLIPAVWEASDMLQFMKDASYRDPLTAVAFVGGGNVDKGQGFMVIEMPRHMLEMQRSEPWEFLYLLTFMGIVFLFFILMSVLFFARIRKRLIRLQTAMVDPGKEGIPLPVNVRASDEIGQLEESFNQMVHQLTDSRHREREEEQLRKRLVAGLSHDLRTPLTVIRGHMHALHKEALSENGLRALMRMEAKMDDLGGLIDNMLSYNLLASGKYTLKLEDKDVLRIVREMAASWYPVWEREQFEIDIDLPDESLIWRVDEQGFRRVLDNLFQNAVRHAAAGRYIGIATEEIKGQRVIVVRDAGPGMQKESETRGTGLGLSIVDLLIREMGLRKRVESSAQGVAIYIYSGVN
ncbi:HAMP domain-containing sensor histidine kinase [Paenibacillus sp. FSL W8-0426]|uniref:HAMP domain-containing sensor histidine kinase n=1 Tax=Paenibacillus sp. FSL W8-0426 TaxID=2921714 RepID=UPI0030D89B16